MPQTPLFTNPLTPNVDGVMEGLMGVCSIAWNRPDGFTILQNYVGSVDDEPLFIFQPETAPPNLAGYRLNGEVYLYCDGTYNVTQLMGDLTGAFGVKFEDTDNVVHSFFYNAAKQFLFWIQVWLSFQPLSNYRGWNLYGHSYGGGAMGCLATLLKRNGATNINVCAYSGPRWAASPAPEGAVRGYLNIHGNADPIPYVPNGAFNATIALPPGLGLVTGTPVIWEDLSTHFEYTGTGVTPGPQDSPLRLYTSPPPIWADQHVLCGHLKKVSGWWHEVHGANSTNSLLTYMDELCTLPRPETIPPQILNLSDLEIYQIPSIYFRNNPSVSITRENLPGVQVGSAASLVPINANMSSIGTITGNNQGEAMSFGPGYKFTCFFQDGPSRGWSESFYTNVNTLGLANTIALNYLTARIPCLGHKLNGAAGPGSPMHTYTRISSIGNINATNLYGPYSTTGTVLVGEDHGAEPPPVALYNRLSVSMTVGGKLAKGSRSFFLHGVPDEIIVDETYQTAGGDNTTFAGVINNYFLFLANNINLCIAAEDPTAPTGGITGGSIVNGQWVLTATQVGAGSPALAPNDRIYIKGARPNTFDGSWTVVAVSTGTPNSIVLANGPPSGTPAINNGTWTKTYDAATKGLMKVLIPFNSNPSWSVQPINNLTVYQVRSHKVGRPFTQYRSTKKHSRARLS